MDCADAQADLYFRILHMTVIFLSDLRVAGCAIHVGVQISARPSKAVIVLSGEHCIEIICRAFSGSEFAVAMEKVGAK